MKGGFGSGNAQGTTDQTKQIPPVGSKIYTEFENNSQYHGVYHGGSATEDKKNPEFTGDNYGHTYGHADPGGNLFKVSTKEGEEEITQQHVSGTTQKMDKDGNYSVDAMKAHNIGAESHSVKTDKDHSIDAGGAANWKIKDALNIDAGGSATLKFGGALTIEATSITLKHGGLTSTTQLRVGAGGPGSPSSPSNRTKPAKRQRPQYKAPGTKV